MPYAGKIYRGVDYSPKWTGWQQNPGNTQTNDSDFANDAFASLWGNAYQPAPSSSDSVPAQNSIYRNDLGTIKGDTFDLVRLYNWGPNRGTEYTAPPYPPTGPNLPLSSDQGLDHLNFLNYAGQQKLNVVVPVSDYFLGNGFYTGQDGPTYGAWGGFTPDATYSFGKAPKTIQDSFRQFIASITDPTTGRIHNAIHSIAIGNEGDLGQGITDGTTASEFLARTNWWIKNLHQQINGQSSPDPNGFPVVNGSTGRIIPITFTISDADQGATSAGGWWNSLINGVSTSTSVPTGFGGWNNENNGLFPANVTGLSQVDTNWSKYYFNSSNIQQNGTGIKAALTAYDNFTSGQWPYFNFSTSNVPLMFMEVGPPNVQQRDPAHSLGQATAIESYLRSNAGSTNLMGYSYFEFNDEPLIKYNGLYKYAEAPATANTGTTSTAFGGIPSIPFPVETLTPASGTGTIYPTLVQAWTSQFPATQTGTSGADNLVGTAGIDRIEGGGGNDSIDGGQGYDVAIYGQNGKAYALKVTAGSGTITVQSKVGMDGTDTLTGIELVRFADGAAVSTASMIATAALPAVQILKVVDLYTAGLGRAPDAMGLDYWASQLAGGTSLNDISKQFFSSAEAAPIYTSSVTTPIFVSMVYATALGRAPDAAGAAYWANELETGNIQRTNFVTALIDGARSTTSNAADAQYIANKESVGGHFALTQGLNNRNSAIEALSGVNGTAASVTAANAKTDAFAATAATVDGSELVMQIVGLVP